MRVALPRSVVTSSAGNDLAVCQRGVAWRGFAWFVEDRAHVVLFFVLKTKTKFCEWRSVQCRVLQNLLEPASKSIDLD